MVGKEKYPAVGTASSLALLHDMAPPCHDSINHLRYGKKMFLEKKKMEEDFI